VVEREAEKPVPVVMPAHVPKGYEPPAYTGYDRLWVACKHRLWSDRHLRSDLLAVRQPGATHAHPHRGPPIRLNHLRAGLLAAHVQKALVLRHGQHGGGRNHVQKTPPAPRPKASVSSGRRRKTRRSVWCGTPELVLRCRWMPPIMGQKTTSMRDQVFFQQSVAALEVFAQLSRNAFSW